MRSAKLGREKKLLKYHAPVDRRLERTSAILNAVSGRASGMSLRKDLAEGEEKPEG
jgi:hypothetical protein